MKTEQVAFEKITIFNHKNVNYKRYSKFNDLEDFNNQWEMIMSIHKKKFTKKQHEFMTVVRRKAAKFPGVALASYSTYAEDYQKLYGCTISEDTMRRTIDRMEKLGIAIKNFGKRMIEGHGSQTANVIIFNRYSEVMAYKAVQDAKTQAELEKLLAEEYAKTEKMMNWATESKQIAKKSNEQDQPAAENKKQAPEKAPESNRKQQSMYVRMLNTYKPRNDEQKAKFNELVAVAYSLKKRAINEQKMYETQVERIILSAFEALLEKDNVKNQAAMFSVIIKNKINNFVGNNQPTKAGGYVEQVPQYILEQREERTANEKAKEAKQLEDAKKRLYEYTGQSTEEVLDFEKAKQEMLRKLREK